MHEISLGSFTVKLVVEVEGQKVKEVKTEVRQVTPVVQPRPTPCPSKLQGIRKVLWDHFFAKDTPQTFRTLVSTFPQIPSGSLSGALWSLEQGGYLKATRHPDDHRAKVYELKETI